MGELWARMQSSLSQSCLQTAATSAMERDFIDSRQTFLLPLAGFIVILYLYSNHLRGFRLGLQITES